MEPGQRDPNAAPAGRHDSQSSASAAPATRAAQRSHRRGLDDAAADEGLHVCYTM